MKHIYLIAQNVYYNMRSNNSVYYLTQALHDIFLVFKT